MISVNVLKKDGRMEAFQLDKIINSCRKAGISEGIAKKIAEEASKRAYPNIPTSEIRKIVAKWLGRYDKEAADRYIKYEIMRLLPAKKKAYKHKFKRKKRER